MASHGAGFFDFFKKEKTATDALWINIVKKRKDFLDNIDQEIKNRNDTCKDTESKKTKKAIKNMKSSFKKKTFNEFLHKDLSEMKKIAQNWDERVVEYATKLGQTCGSFRPVSVKSKLAKLIDERIDSENKIEKAIKKIETAAINNTDPTPYILEIKSILTVPVGISTNQIINPSNKYGNTSVTTMGNTKGNQNIITNNSGLINQLSNNKGNINQINIVNSPAKQYDSTVKTILTYKQNKEIRDKNIDFNTLFKKKKGLYANYVLPDEEQTQNIKIYINNLEQDRDETLEILELKKQHLEEARNKVFIISQDVNADPKNLKLAEKNTKELEDMVKKYNSIVDKQQLQIKHSTLLSESLNNHKQTVNTLSQKTENYKGHLAQTKAKVNKLEKDNQKNIPQIKKEISDLKKQINTELSPEKKKNLQNMLKTQTDILELQKTNITDLQKQMRELRANAAELRKEINNAHNKSEKDIQIISDRDNKISETRRETAQDLQQQLNDTQNQDIKTDDLKRPYNTPDLRQRPNETHDEHQNRITQFGKEQREKELQDQDVSKVVTKVPKVPDVDPADLEELDEASVANTEGDRKLAENLQKEEYDSNKTPQQLQQENDDLQLAEDIAKKQIDEATEEDLKPGADAALAQLNKVEDSGEDSEESRQDSSDDSLYIPNTNSNKDIAQDISRLNTEILSLQNNIKSGDLTEGEQISAEERIKALQSSLETNQKLLKAMKDDDASIGDSTLEAQEELQAAKDNHAQQLLLRKVELDKQWKLLETEKNTTEQQQNDILKQINNLKDEILKEMKRFIPVSQNEYDKQQDKYFGPPGSEKNINLDELPEIDNLITKLEDIKINRQTESESINQRIDNKILPLIEQLRSLKTQYVDLYSQLESVKQEIAQNRDEMSSLTAESDEVGSIESPDLRPDQPPQITQLISIGGKRHKLKKLKKSKKASKKKSKKEAKLLSKKKK